MKTFISQDRKMNSLTVLKKSPAKDAAWNKATALYLLLPAGRQASRKKKLLGYSKGKPERPEQQVPRPFLCGHAEEDWREGTVYRWLCVASPLQAPAVELLGAALMTVTYVTLYYSTIS